MRGNVGAMGRARLETRRWRRARRGGGCLSGGKGSDGSTAPGYRREFCGRVSCCEASSCVRNYGVSNQMETTRRRGRASHASQPATADNACWQVANGSCLPPSSQISDCHHQSTSDDIILLNSNANPPALNPQHTKPRLLLHPLPLPPPRRQRLIPKTRAPPRHAPLQHAIHPQPEPPVPAAHRQETGLGENEVRVDAGGREVPDGRADAEVGRRERGGFPEEAASAEEIVSV